MTVLTIYLAVGAASWFVISIFTNERVKQLAERPEEPRGRTDNLIEQRWGEPKFMWRMFALVLICWPLFAPQVVTGSKILTQHFVRKNALKAKIWVSTEVWTPLLLVVHYMGVAQSERTLRQAFTRARMAAAQMREIAELLAVRKIEEATEKWHELIENPTVPAELGAEIYASIVKERIKTLLNEATDTVSGRPITRTKGG